MGFNRMKLDTKLVGSSILVATLMVFFFIQFLSLLHSAGKGLDRVVKASTAIRVAQELNNDFQLAVSKGKDVAIVKDQKHKDATTVYLKRAQEALEDLQKSNPDADEQDDLRKLGDQLESVGGKLTTLIQMDIEKPTSLELYTSYLKDITIQFDDTNQSYVDLLDKKVEESQAAVIAQIEQGKLIGTLLVVLVLGGILLNLLISMGVARTLRTLT